MNKVANVNIRTIAGFVFSVPSRHGKINELLKQLCNQFHICFKNETYKSYEKNLTENGKCGLCFLLKVFPIYQFDSFYIIRHEHIKNQHNTTIIYETDYKAALIIHLFFHVYLAH
jgi:hypothetical protein